MGKFLLAGRLAARDLRRHPAQVVLLLLVITATSATLTLALAVHGVTDHPYQQTRAATSGPDVVAYLPAVHQPGQLASPPAAQAGALIRAPGVTGYSGPYPLWGPWCGHTAAARRPRPKGAASPRPRSTSRS